MAESLYQESIQLTGLPGATAQSRYVGATVSGYPTSGSFVTGDFIIDQSGTTWVCTSGGSPGTWLNPLNKVTNSVASAYYTSQTAQLGPINLYTAPASGFYQLNYYAKVTSTGTTSTLGPITVTSTDIDGTSITNYGDATSANTVASGFINGMIPLLVGSGTTISYTIPYTSSGSPMGYEAYVNLTSTNLTQNASPVVSFNGRTGAVTPGSSDYTAAQVGALASTQNVAGKNFLINGGFDIWQRGTSFSTNGYNYTSDRWLTNINNATVSQQTSGAAVGTAGHMRITYTGSSAVGDPFQALESSMAQLLAGQTVTASCLVRRNSSLTSDLSISIQKNSTANTQLSGSWTTVATGTLANASIPTGTGSANWAPITCTYAVPNDGTAAGIRVVVYENTAGTSGGYYEVTGVQLEIGSTATAFSRAGGTIQGELAACQRYYVSLNTSNFYVYGNFWNSANGILFTALPSTMRVTPTVALPSSVTNMSQVVGLSNFTPSSPSASATTNSFSFGFAGGSACYSAGQPVTLNGGFVFTVSAEL